LDVDFFAACRAEGFSLPEVPPPDRASTKLFGSCKLPYTIGPGCLIVELNLSEWEQAMRGLLALAHRRGGRPASPEGGDMPGIDPRTPRAPGHTDQEKAAILGGLAPAARKSYVAYLLAERRAGRKLQDREAYELLRDEDVLENASTPELADYHLPTLDTWTRHLRTARKELGEQKNTPRRGRPHGPSVIRQDQIEQPEREG
jgi:hypothetical protein